MRASFSQRSPGSWSVRIDFSRGSDGRRRQKRFTVRGTKKQAEARAAQVIYELESGSFVEREEMLLRQYLEKWLVSRESRVAATTATRYRGMVCQHIIPAIGSIELSKVTPLHIEEAISRWRSDVRHDRKSGALSERTLHHIFMTLKSALRQAVRWQMITRNPCEAIAPPRFARRQIRALNERDATTLLNGLRGTPLFAIVLVAIATGLRRGELLALRWEDVDFESGALHVRRSLERLRDGTLRFKEPKTAKSRRTVALPRFAIDELRRHRIEQSKRRLLLGGAFQDCCLVFPDVDGSPWDPDKLSSAFYYGIRARDLPIVSFHGLRHSYATIMLRVGTPLKVASESLGHTTIAVTADLYTHVLDDLHHDAAERLDDALGAGLRMHQ